VLLVWPPAEPDRLAPLAPPAPMSLRGVWVVAERLFRRVKPSKYTIGDHARPEQGNGPAADGASFSLTLKFIGVRKEPLLPSGTKTIRGLGNRSARFHPSTVCVPRAFPGSHELRNVVAKSRL
jgi:hypothetical protein